MYIKDAETFKYKFVNCGYGELRGSDNKIGIGPVTATPWTVSDVVQNKFSTSSSFSSGNWGLSKLVIYRVGIPKTVEKEIFVIISDTFTCLLKMVYRDHTNRGCAYHPKIFIMALRLSSEKHIKNAFDPGNRINIPSSLGEVRALHSSCQS